MRARTTVDNPRPTLHNTVHRDDFGAGRESAMDHETRNEFEQFCALAEIEQDPDKFVEIKRSIVRLLDEKENRLNRWRLVTDRLRYPAVPSSA
jgi:hypothetical protein